MNTENLFEKESTNLDFLDDILDILERTYTRVSVLKEKVENQNNKQEKEQGKIIINTPENKQEKTTIKISSKSSAFEAGQISIFYPGCDIEIDGDTDWPLSLTLPKKKLEEFKSREKKEDIQSENLLSTKAKQYIIRDILDAFNAGRLSEFSSVSTSHWTDFQPDFIIVSKGDFSNFLTQGKMFI